MSWCGIWIWGKISGFQQKFSGGSFAVKLRYFFIFHFAAPFAVCFAYCALLRNPFDSSHYEYFSSSHVWMCACFPAHSCSCFYRRIAAARFLCPRQWIWKIYIPPSCISQNSISHWSIKLDNGYISLVAKKLHRSGFPLRLNGLQKFFFMRDLFEQLGRSK